MSVLVDVEGVSNLAVNEPGCVKEVDGGELLRVGGGHANLQVLHDPSELLDATQVRLELDGTVALHQVLALALRDDGEALAFHRNSLSGGKGKKKRNAQGVRPRPGPHSTRSQDDFIAYRALELTLLRVPGVHTGMHDVGKTNQRHTRPHRHRRTS